MTEHGPVSIGGHEVEPGTRARIELPISRRFTGAEILLPVEIVHGREPGPRLFVSAAIHGDEINGVEIIRRVLRRAGERRLCGTLVAVPIVNIFGFIGLTRYLPDRRDLNRTFPGSASGSLASRLAHIFMTEIVAGSTHGIDLHTGAVHRSNLPQVRASLDRPGVEALARAFAVPVILNSDLRDGSLRQEVSDRGIPMLVYEGGEALRFDETAIRAGVHGVVSVMRSIGMLPPASSPPKVGMPFVARSSHWVRAPKAGILRTRVALGAAVKQGGRLGVIADPLGTEEERVAATHSGVVIGRTELPLVNEGDALFHVATFDVPKEVASSVADFREGLDAEGRPSIA